MPIPEEERRFEGEIQKAGATKGARLTPQDIEDLITHEDYWRVPGTTTTVCALTLRNGFVVIGSSGCVDPENFREELGKEAAYKAARSDIWQLEGYAMTVRMHEHKQSYLKP